MQVLCNRALNNLKLFPKRWTQASQVSSLGYLLVDFHENFARFIPRQFQDLFFFLANTRPKVWITSIEQYFWRILAFLPSSFSQKLSYFVFWQPWTLWVYLLHKQAGCRASCCLEQGFFFILGQCTIVSVVWIFILWLALAGNEEVTRGLEPIINGEIFWMNQSLANRAKALTEMAI